MNNVYQELKKELVLKNYQFIEVQDFETASIRMIKNDILLIEVTHDVTFVSNSNQAMEMCQSDFIDIIINNSIKNL